MVGPSRLYTTSEGEAFKCLCEKFSLPQGNDLQLVPFSWAGVETFSGQSGGREASQPLFKEVTPKPPARRLEFELTYSVAEEEAVSAPAARPRTTHEDNSEDDNADQALTSMDDSFSKWASSRQEGVNAVPFAVIRAPEDAHEALIARDRSSWSSTPDPATGTNDTNLSILQGHHLVQDLCSGTTAGLTTSQSNTSPAEQNSSDLKDMSRDDATSNHSGDRKEETALNEDRKDENALNEKDFPSKRAYLIAKAKLAKDKLAGSSTVLTSMFANHKRAAAAKNKNRKPITETPEPKATEFKPKVGKGETMVCYDNTPEGHKSALKLAIQNGCIDPNNEEEVKNLMYQLEHTTNKMLKTNNTEMERNVTPGGAVLGRFNYEEVKKGGETEKATQTEEAGDIEKGADIKKAEDIEKGANIEDTEGIEKTTAAEKSDPVESQAPKSKGKNKKKKGKKTGATN